VKAVIQDSYGPIAALETRDIDKPAVGPGQVLVRVRAAGLHIGDCFSVKGSPFLVRAMTGLRRPKYGVPGFDLAGEVVAVGAGVTRLRPGDEVFGSGIGTCAEYAAADEDKLAAKPTSLTFEQAAAIPTSALAALHGLRDAAKLRPGQRILINGASGGVGTFAVQIAKALGAHVTGVCGTKNVELVHSIGADEVIDYAKDDFTKGRRYDVVLDNIENRSLREVRRALTPTGVLVLNSGTGASGLRMLTRLMWPLVLSRFVRHTLRRFISNPNAADLGVLKTMVEDGTLRPVIESTYPLPETRIALQHIESGHARGKVVIAVAATSGS
jgi:NADPH:quinone reductase-like Zn-dependent oxidoreductase